MVDLSDIDLETPIITHQQVYQVNPHRYEFELLDGIFSIDLETGTMVGYRDCKPDEFWVKAHIPGRPIFPGVLMIETAAQLVSYCAMRRNPGKGFLGFGGVDGVKFRGSVKPGDRIIMVGKMLEDRPRRCVGQTQAFVKDQMVYEGTITGMWI